MSDNVINLSDKRKEAERGAYSFTAKVYQTQSGYRAEIDHEEEGIERDTLSEAFRALAWMVDIGTDEEEGPGVAPIVSINLFEDGRIDFRLNDHVVTNLDNLHWIRAQILDGMSDIDRFVLSGGRDNGE